MSEETVHAIRIVMAASQDTLKEMLTSRCDNGPLCESCFTPFMDDLIWKVDMGLQALKEAPEAENLDYLHGYLVGFEEGRKTVRTNNGTVKQPQAVAANSGSLLSQVYVEEPTADPKKHPINMLITAAENTYWAMRESIDNM